MNLPKTARLVEVGPRDGLQNEAEIIPTETKIAFIDRLSQSGLTHIEVTSFVSPKRIPQLSDAEAVLKGIKRVKGLHYSAIVPNVQGLQAAIHAGVKEVAVLSAASETFSKKNTHCSIEEGLQRIQDILQIAKSQSQPIPVRAYISCVLGCPYEGEVPVAKVVELATKLLDLGCNEISLGDTIGVGTPRKAQDLISGLLKAKIPVSQLAVHFHDTYGQALANIYACLEMGISIIDSAVSGLGGCPYAKGTTGNVATEDVLFMLEGLGISTGVKMETLLEISHFVSAFLNRKPRSKVAQAKLGMPG